MIILENIETGDIFRGDDIEFFVDDDTLIGEVYLDGELIYQDMDIVDEDQLELSFNRCFIQTNVDPLDHYFI